MISEAITIHSELGLNHKRAGVKKALSEQKHGDSFSVRVGRWMRRSGAWPTRHLDGSCAAVSEPPRGATGETLLLKIARPADRVLVANMVLPAPPVITQAGRPEDLRAVSSLAGDNEGAPKRKPTKNMTKLISLRIKNYKAF